MNFFERYLLSRIDRALDDGKPLTGLTRLFVQRYEPLRRYYESMLALELELRFSDDIPSEPCTLPTAGPFPRNRPIAALFHPLGYAAAVCLLIVAGIFVPSAPEPPPSVFVPTVVVADPTPTDDFALESLSAIVPWEEIHGVSSAFVPPSLWQGPPVLSPIDSLIAFSERPLELTTTLLEHVGSFIAKADN